MLTFAGFLEHGFIDLSPAIGLCVPEFESSLFPSFIKLHILSAIGMGVAWPGFHNLALLIYKQSQW